MDAAAANRVGLRLWVAGDWNGFFGLFTNVLLNVIVLTGLCLGVVQLPAEQFTTPSTLLISATVQDETNQTVTRNLTLPLHRTRLYLGVDSGGWVAEAQKPQRVRFVALSPDGKPVLSNASYRV